jgi:hypothetical protein
MVAQRRRRITLAAIEAERPHRTRRRVVDANDILQRDRPIAGKPSRSRIFGKRDQRRRALDGGGLALRRLTTEAGREFSDQPASPPRRPRPAVKVPNPDQPSLRSARFPAARGVYLNDIGVHLRTL